MSKVSRAAVFAADDNDTDIPAQKVEVLHPTQIDRVQELRIVTADEAATVATILGDDILDDQTALMAILKAQKEIRADAGRLLNAAIDMGRTLNDLQGTVGRTRFAQVCKHSSELFPGLSRGNVAKLMAVAEFVDKDVIHRDLLPPTYSVVYELTTVPPTTLRDAYRSGTLRPNITRAEVQNWKQSLEERSSMIVPQQERHEVIQRAALQQELEKIRRDRASLTERNLALRRRQREIEHQLNKSPTRMLAGSH